MDIYIIRHAQALDKNAPIEDAQRPLTARGRKDSRKLGKALRDADVTFDAIITSPLVRSVETATLVAVGARFEGALDVAAELSPSANAEQVVKEVLLPRADLDRVAIVGHQPQLSAIAELLLGHPVPELAKPSVIRLRWEGPEHPAKLKWVLRANGEGTSKHLADVAE